MSAFGIPDSEVGAGNGLVLGTDDRLEAMAWALRDAATWSDLNDIRYGAPYRALMRRNDAVAQRAARLFQQRWQEIEAHDRARSAEILAGRVGLSASVSEGGRNQPPQEKRE